jgi:hypothetical protein
VARRIWSIKNRNDPIGNRARELPAYGAVPCNFSISTNELTDIVKINIL